MFVILYI